jgi:hypothetical protein
MSDFDARLERDASALRRAQSLGANPSFVLDFAVAFLFFVVGILTLFATSIRDDAAHCDLPMHDYPFVGWIIVACIIIGTAVVARVPFGEHIPMIACALLGLVLGAVAVINADLPGYITFGVVCLGAVLVLFTPNGGNFMLMGMAVLSLGVGIVTIWAAALAMLGLDTPA